MACIGDGMHPVVSVIQFNTQEMEPGVLIEFYILPGSVP